MSEVETSIPANPDADDPGVSLREARRHKGISRSDLADFLRIDEAVIAALEDGHYEKLPARVYVRGYLRAYARLVNLDADAMVASFAAADSGYQARAGFTLTAAKPSFFERAKRNPGRFIGGVVAVVVVLVILGLLVFWWRFVRPDSPLNLLAQSAATVVMPPPLAATGAAQGGGQSPLARGQLMFEFRKDSWVEVRDSDEQLIHFDLGHSGESLSVVGKPPFRVLIGYAAGVELAFNGGAVALAPYTRRNVARLVVGS